MAHMSLTVEPPAPAAAMPTVRKRASPNHRRLVARTTLWSLAAFAVVLKITLAGF
jgi:type VI protein secretion system component VasF